MCQNSKAVGLAKRKVNWAREKIFYPPSPQLLLLIEGQPEEFLILLPILLPLYNDEIKDGGHGNMNIHKQLKSFSVRPTKYICIAGHIHSYRTQTTSL